MNEKEKKLFIKNIKAHPSQTKHCLQCGKEKALSEFSYLSDNWDGYYDICRECMYKYNKKKVIYSQDSI